MKVLVLYRPNSEHGRLIEDFIHEIQHNTPIRQLEVLSVDTRDGIATATLYDVVRYPAVLVVQNDGYIQKMWMGPEEMPPLINDVVAYAAA